jgi:hypothetical protein
MFYLRSNYTQPVHLILSYFTVPHRFPEVRSFLETLYYLMPVSFIQELTEKLCVCIYTSVYVISDQ